MPLGALEGWKGAGGSRPSTYNFKKKKIAAIYFEKVSQKYYKPNMPLLYKKTERQTPCYLYYYLIPTTYSYKEASLIKEMILSNEGM